ncbi:MAG TPA: DUF4347 domain-containing protein, partial [Burkholderiaceae bacterium]|nr:DUF4347 domain-containing protein [Burkholderiaceae bacterium]
MLFDGAAVVVADQMAEGDSGAASHHDAPATDAQPRTVSDFEHTGEQAPAASRNELLFVDTTVQDWQSIVANVRADVQVVVLDPAGDPLDQIAQWMGEGEPVDAVHIISHGAAGSLQIGGRSVDLSSLQGYATQLAAIGSHLTSDGDILLYGCDIAGGDGGQRFVQALADATGADVAASVDGTGSADRGGNWVLELHTGRVDAVAVHAEAFAGLLVAPSVTAAENSLSVVEPSSLNEPGASEVSLGDLGWTITDDGSGDIVVEVLLSNAGAGTLTNVGTAVAIEEGGLTGYRYQGERADAQAWLNGLQFNAADVELGITAATTTISVRVTDLDDPSNPSGAKEIVITVTPSNDPVTLGDATQTITEGEGGNGGVAISVETLNPIDPEWLEKATQDSSQITYKLGNSELPNDGMPMYGYLTLDGVRLGAGSIFTHADVMAGKLKYVHSAAGSADQNKDDSFSVRINDGATPLIKSDSATITLDITPVNQAPTVGGSGSVYEGQPANATGSVVGGFIDATTGGDPGDSIDTLKITSLPSEGKLFFTGHASINGEARNLIDYELTTSDLAGLGFVIRYADRNGLRYAHDGSESTGTDTFGVEVTDTGSGSAAAEDRPLSSTGTVTITVMPANDDPTLLIEAPVATVEARNEEPHGYDYSVVLDGTMLRVDDPDSEDARITFVVTDTPHHGRLMLNGRWLDAGDTFTLSDVKSNSVTYW